MIGNINIFNSGEFANFKSNVKQYSMKKLYSVYFLSLFMLFFCSCSTKKAQPESPSKSEDAPLAIEENSIQETVQKDSKKEMPISGEGSLAETQNTESNDILKLLIEKNSVLTTTELYNELVRKVTNKVTQTPQYGKIGTDDEGGDFIFVPKN